MAIYILLSKLTSLGRKTIKDHPGRIKEVNKEIEAFGARVVEQYVTLGPYDFVNVVEAPDNKTITRISVELGSRGTIVITTLPAMTLTEFISTVKKKCQTSYRNQCGLRRRAPTKSFFDGKARKPT